LHHFDDLAFWSRGVPPRASNVMMMADLRYTVIIEPDDGAFSVIVPAFPEISTFGETHEAALEMARDAIRLSLEYRRDNELDIPTSDVDQTRVEGVAITYPAA
jgi:predicted RNase H-like HicB family nuclease